MGSMISDVFRQRTAVGGRGLCNIDKFRIYEMAIKQIEKSWPSEIRTNKSQVEKLQIIGIFSSHQDFLIFDTLLCNSEFYR